MEPIIAVIVSRAIERMLVVLVGGSCIYLGWRLFIQRQLDDSKSELVAGLANFKITLKRIGPGVIFAAFGAAVVVTSFFHGVEFDRKYAQLQPSVCVSPNLVNPPAVAVIEENFKGIGGSIDAKEVIKTVVALNQILQLADTNTKEFDLITARIGDLRLQEPHLVKLRDQLVIAREGTELVNLWRKDGAKYRVDPQSFRQEERDKLKEIEPWYSTVPTSEIEQ